MGMVAACKSAGYYGMGILPCNGMGVDFMSPEFLKHYRVAVDEAGRLGMKMCLYDEFWFPSGSAGGLLAKKHPEALSKRLDMRAADVAGPQEFTQAVPEGTLMGAVAMEMATKRRLDITASIKDGTLRWKVAAGEWKVMIFTCVRDGGDGLVDYLEPKAVDAFIKLTYQAYQDAMPEQCPVRYARRAVCHRLRQDHQRLVHCPSHGPHRARRSGGGGQSADRHRGRPDQILPLPERAWHRSDRCLWPRLVCLQGGQFGGP
jgi:hypothetical protein